MLFKLSKLFNIFLRMKVEFLKHFGFPDLCFQHFNLQTSVAFVFHFTFIIMLFFFLLVVCSLWVTTLGKWAACSSTLTVSQMHIRWSVRWGQQVLISVQVSCLAYRLKTPTWLTKKVKWWAFSSKLLTARWRKMSSSSSSSSFKYDI